MPSDHQASGHENTEQEERIVKLFRAALEAKKAYRKAVQLGAKNESLLWYHQKNTRESLLHFIELQLLQHEKDN